VVYLVGMTEVPEIIRFVHINARVKTVPFYHFAGSHFNTHLR